jgi:hypothetical protein
MNQATSQREARGRPMSNLELAESFGSVSPALRTALDLHLKAHGTLIPHVFMGTVLAHVKSSLPPGPVAEPAAEVAGILETLERGMDAGERETRNVISISFVREAEGEPYFAVIAPLLGPRVRAQLLAR